MFILFKKHAIKELKRRLTETEEQYEARCEIAKEYDTIDYEMSHDAVYQRGIIFGMQQAIRTLENL